MAVVVTFDGYPGGTQLDAHADWVVRSGAILVVNPGGAGVITGDSSGVISIADYISGSFSGNQAAEVLFGAAASGSAAHGPAVRIQTNNAYFLFGDNSGTIYLGIYIGGTASFPSNYSPHALTAGSKLRLEATGTGSATRLTGKVDVSGGGWVTLFSNLDPGGTYLSGGNPGVSGFNNGHITTITQWTGEDLATTSAISGSTSLTFGTAGILKGSGTLSGSTSMAFPLAGVIRGNGALSGASALSFLAAGALSGPATVQISGSSSLSFATTGAILGTGRLVGASSLAFAPLGTLGSFGALQGASSLNFTVSGTGTAINPAIAGSANLLFTVSGTIRNASLERPVTYSTGALSPFWYLS